MTPRHKRRRFALSKYEGEPALVVLLPLVVTVVCSRHRVAVSGAVGVPDA